MGGSNRTGHLVKFLATKIVWAALLVALVGYFFDVECMINRCETASSGHGVGQCVSPMVIPDAHQPAQIAEFSIIPVLLDLVAVCQPSEEITKVAKTFWPLRPPPEHLLSATAHSRRGPPVRA